MSKLYLAKSDFNWADEMDLLGFTIIDEEAKLEFEKLAKDYEDVIKFYVGTNEEVTFKNGQDVLDHITFTEITPETSVAIVEAFEGEDDEDIFNMIYEYLCSLSDDPDYEQIDALVDNLEEGSANFNKLESQARIWYDNEEKEAKAEGYSMTYGFDLISETSEIMSEEDDDEITTVEFEEPSVEMQEEDLEENAPLEPVE